MSEPRDPQDFDDEDRDDEVDEAGRESFPASDPPSWTPPGHDEPLDAD